MKKAMRIMVICLILGTLAYGLTLKKRTSYECQDTIQVEKDDVFKIMLNGESLLGGPNGITMPADGEIRLDIHARFEE